MFNDTVPGNSRVNGTRRSPRFWFGRAKSASWGAYSASPARSIAIGARILPNVVGVGKRRLGINFLVSTTLDVQSNFNDNGSHKWSQECERQR